ncbi:hypothetical protein NEFER03_0876 [Nematocida sp. LUAm3]|nr:hypothetical protein NEFER03_0876 [Nematocida sp. LUAm3]KAI5174894.1 hypothetical protein NEFER02_0994 [Nematocida sp. LUAm2]KAI5177508.1 hypothetical protein NEFER01_0758 [Nematocida sp. LUAm1]
MGNFLSKRKPVREQICLLEKQIEKEEKKIKEMIATSSSFYLHIYKLIGLVSFIGSAIIWVCKESLSYSTIGKIALLAFLINLLLYFITATAKKLYLRGIHKRKAHLRNLRKKQIENIEFLKKETKYDETHNIVQKYRRPGLESEETKEENVVEQIVSKLIQ